MTNSGDDGGDSAHPGDGSPSLSFADAVHAGLAAAAPPPPAIDLRDAGWETSPAEDALFRLDWGVLDEALRWLLAKSGRLSGEVRVSVMPLWQAQRGHDPAHFPLAEDGLLGDRLVTVLDLARRIGVLREDQWPTVGPGHGCDLLRQMLAAAARLRIAGYCPLEPKAAHWRTWIANNGPILARSERAVAIIGYRPDSFLVCDSWCGAGAVQAVGVDAMPAFTEAYGVVV